MTAPDPTAVAPARRRGVPGVRWYVAGFLLVLSVLNYVDRQALSVLAPVIQRELELTDADYARVGQAFLLCYTLAYLAAGRLVDRFGPRTAEAGFVAWWSVANMATALAAGFGSLAAVRAVLGLGEPGHYAVAAKVVGQWFPPKEKGVAAGLYMMGGTLGAAIAAPLVAWLALTWGWRSAFVVTGGAGLILAVLWWLAYRPPWAHPWVGADEAELLRAHGLLSPPDVRATPSVRSVLGWKPLWLILAARAVTDPVWYFYLIWFAKYLQDVRGFTLAEVGATVWVVFVAADVGCLAAGGASGWLIRRGRRVLSARLAVMAVAAAVLGLSFLVPALPGKVWPLVLASVFAGCVMLFMASAVTLPLDLFPRAALGTAQGVIGMGGSVGGFVTTGLIGWVLTEHRSYDAVFAAMSVAHPLAAVALILLLPRLTRGGPPS